MKQFNTTLILVCLTISLTASQDHTRPTPSPDVDYIKVVGYTAATVASLWRLSHVQVTNLKKYNLGSLIKFANHAYLAYHVGSNALKELNKEAASSDDQKLTSSNKITSLAKLIGCSVITAFNTVASGILGYSALFDPKHINKNGLNDRPLTPIERALDVHSGLVFGWNAKLSLYKAVEEYQALKRAFAHHD